jgi:hypothetical protein
LTKCALYRHFDKTGNLLYVGIACNPFRRSVDHSCNADWFERVARIDIEWHLTRDAALWFEEMAIARENPKYNRMRPAGIGEGAELQPMRKGIRARKPEIQQQINAILEEAASLGHRLSRNACLSVVQQQLGWIKEGKTINF